MTLADVHRREREALLGEYLFGEGFGGGMHIMPYSAVPAIGDLTTTPRFLRAKHPVAIRPFPGADPARGFVQLCPSLDSAFLWLPPADDAYRDHYRAFLAAFHGVRALTADYDVDHLFNRARAIELGLPFVRMILLGPGENRSHGAGYEAGRTRAGINRGGRQRGIDDVMLMKLCGIRSPRQNQPLSPEMLAHVARIAALFGLPPQEVERNIRELMAIAAHRH